jgi:uncharacterized protein (DUF305 family)
MPSRVTNAAGRVESAPRRPTAPDVPSAFFLEAGTAVIILLDMRLLLPRIAAVTALVAFFASCKAARDQSPPPSQAANSPAAAHAMPMAPVKIPAGAVFTEADVRFMQGMIAHHAQAIYMSRMASGHGASPHLLKFAQKIDQSQIVEIRLMQDWLRANGQEAPDTSSWRSMQMPGMLTADQLKQLDASKGTEFDRQFLVLMIQHHNGALKMVSDLFATPQAAQDVDVSVFANDVQAVQTAEIGTMQQMLGTL